MFYVCYVSVLSILLCPEPKPWALNLGFICLTLCYFYQVSFLFLQQILIHQACFEVTRVGCAFYLFCLILGRSCVEVFLQFLLEKHGKPVLLIEMLDLWRVLGINNDEAATGLVIWIEKHTPNFL